MFLLEIRGRKGLFLGSGFCSLVCTAVHVLVPHSPDDGGYVISFVRSLQLCSFQEYSGCSGSRALFQEFWDHHISLPKRQMGFRQGLC